MSVRFSSATRISYVPNLSDHGPDDIDALYNTPEDKHRIETEVIGSIKTYRNWRQSP
eukprot:CAMPEP_0197456824 /NCGR_PEP_ID=MMETSP1175-20131217/44373_1 /TAXON_ID=1003142 /ORGANISM="Triceratium dubium, Strain CCMP147" /LENGTH=56 /DNA_ID=CAMNT_0042991007 /DNA_START=99 /DNA_END=266 /DNA_ORIENTATION=+